jgi:hypothetical protein
MAGKRTMFGLHGWLQETRPRLSNVKRIRTA